ncbi:c-type cytochrome [Weeksellaceae bacterium TAE3-ERU29]|nr:c-type cytochrome [Weeksellaceae bacterium TAE3-ERU29]
MKHRIPGHIFIPITLLVILAAFMMVIPMDFLPQHGLAGVAHNAFYQLKNVFSYWIVWIVLLLSFLMLLIIENLNKVIERKKIAQLTPQERAIFLAEKKEGYLKRLFKSGRERQSEEEEKALLLDHGFDGIQELDNSLPQWWLSMFYMGTAYMIIYVIAYFTTDFAHPVEEYEIETALMDERAQEWIKKNDIKIDQAQNFYQDEGALQRGEEIFKNVCATCHMPNGGGAAGPNLTDDYWINHREGDLFKNIYSMIYDGSPNNPAMQAFGQTNQLTGLDVQDVASYVYHLNQELPPVTEAEGGLAPQGDEMPQWKRK